MILAWVLDIGGTIGLVALALGAAEMLVTLGGGGRKR